MSPLIKNRLVGSIAALAAVFFISSTVYGQDATLSWDKPDDSRVTGYNIYYGTSGSDFKSDPSITVDSADETSCLVEDLEEGISYDFAATSFDADGNESDFSETITHTVEDSDTSDSETQTLVFGDSSDADYPGTVTDTFININEEINVSSEQLNTYTWPDDMAANAALLSFDISGLPEDAQIESATLKLYQIEAGGDDSYSVFVHRLINQNPDFQNANGYMYDEANEWTPNDKCYESIPLAQADIDTAEDVNTLDHSNGTKQWNITSMVQQWQQDPASNYGLLVNSDFDASADSYRFFASSEAGDPSVRPALEITYTVDSSDTDTEEDDTTDETSDDGDTDDTDEEDGGDTGDDTTDTDDSDD
ncbi:MAG: DNRLRE domain-containing protein, partial [Desulfobacterales bacterium]